MNYVEYEKTSSSYESAKRDVLSIADECAFIGKYGNMSAFSNSDAHTLEIAYCALLLIEKQSFSPMYCGNKAGCIEVLYNILCHYNQADEETLTRPYSKKELSGTLLCFYMISIFMGFSEMKSTNIMIYTSRTSKKDELLDMYFNSSFYHGGMPAYITDVIESFSSSMTSEETKLLNEMFCPVHKSTNNVRRKANSLMHRGSGSHILYY